VGLSCGFNPLFGHALLATTPPVRTASQLPIKPADNPTAADGWCDDAVNSTLPRDEMAGEREREGLHDGLAQPNGMSLDHYLGLDRVGYEAVLVRLVVQQLDF
jgi:hypothetical protein